MSSADVLIDAFGRIREVVHEAVDGLHPDDLAFQLEEGTNSIAWLVWHLTRVQDDHVADVAKLRQVWTAKGWDEKFGLPFTADATGYGDGPDEVAALGGTTAELLVGYHDEAISGVRGPWRIPVEDFAFGSALVTLTLLLWCHRRRRDEERADRPRLA